MGRWFGGGGGERGACFYGMEWMLSLEESGSRDEERTYMCV